MNVRRFCQCGHSEGAHLDGGVGRCGFCSCPAFRLDRIEGGPSLSPGAGPVGAGRREDCLTLSQAADRLGFTAATLRKYAQADRFPAEKVRGKWSVLLRDVQDWERRLIKIPRSGKARARLSEAVAFQDMERGLSGRGRLASPPLQPGATFADRARVAASQAIEHQLHPDLVDVPETPLPVTRAKRRRAQIAEREALNDMLRHPGAPHPPERSL